jgi:N-acetylglucosamine-6-sulfatase
MDGYNINGNRVPQKGYITDELTDYALEWLDQNSDEKPFFLFVSHKAVHSDFVAADRHLGRYKNTQLEVPDNFENEENSPMWLINQRNSRHGAEFGYNLPDFDLNKYYQRYCETLLSVDENLGRILDWVDKSEKSENTIVIYMGDNGFQFGEHGLIDKRTAYEASIKVPLLLWGYRRGNSNNKVISKPVANIDIAPTILDLAGLVTPETMDGRSIKPLMDGENIEWRKELLYEYHWERNYPYTPTTHALITERYKFIRYHGIWDLDEFYNILEDPNESRNLINDPAYKELIEQNRTRMFELLLETGGITLPLLPDKGETFILRNNSKSKPAKFPESFYLKD